MPFRTVVISSISKLEYSLEYLVCRFVDETKRIHLSEINTLIIESTAISLTSSLMSELVKRKITVIFCDEKHNPIGEVNSLIGNTDFLNRYKEQASWSEDIKGRVRKEIIKKKIEFQSLFLKKEGFSNEFNLLSIYCNDVQIDDSTNREGHAAKVYFNKIFYPGFNRSEDCKLNAILNYGYTVLLSVINRIVVSYGYLTYLGIHHKSENNKFNLSCDLIEPFRIFVDIYSKKLLNKSDVSKNDVIQLFSSNLLIDGKEQTFFNALNIYINSIFEALKIENPSKIKFPDSHDL